jgi:molybdopterin/thiamine biosynthesis adenylyltransferase
MRAAIIGCGGIGYYLAEGVARVLAAQSKDETTETPEMIFVDGDIIKEKNLDRQFFKGVLGMNKAHALQTLVRDRFGDSRIQFSFVGDFVNEENAAFHRDLWLRPPLTLFVCVDNHRSRAFVEELACRIPDVTMIVGGNDEVNGQAQLFVRRGNRNVTPKITEISPEILADETPLPNIAHCLEEGVSEPQTAQVNRAVALAMEILFLNEADKKKPDTNEIRVDIEKGDMRAFWRDSITGKKEPKKEKKDGRVRNLQGRSVP